MGLFREILGFGFRNCPACGSYLPRESLLCAPCETKVMGLLRPRVETFEGWTLRSLFSWEPGASDALSALLLGLKGPDRRRAWRFWATVFSRHHFAALPKGPVLSVSAPSRSAKAPKDHSTHWTEALSEEHGLFFQGGLFRKADRGSQRGKKGSERHRSLRLVKMTADRPDPSALWVLGDDIFTTGETARAVHRALGRPLRFEVWCLARRERRPPGLRPDP